MTIDDGFPASAGESLPTGAAGAAPSSGSDPESSAARHRPSRRSVIATSIGALAGAAAGVGGMAGVALSRTPADAGAGSGTGRTPEGTPATDPAPTAPYGRTQAGIDRPATPQTFAHFQVGDLGDPHDLAFLAGLGRRIAELTTAPQPDMLPDGPRGLTVTIALGPRVIRAIDRELPGGQPLPQLRGDEAIDPTSLGGDLLITCCADDPSLLPMVGSDLARHLPGWTPRWSQFGYRGPGTGTVARNPLGFLDGISVPHGPAEFDANVWLAGRLAGATICVLRRFRLHTDEFAALPTARRESIIGRRLDGSPLSGGGPQAEVNLNAKRPDGTYLIPARAHVRVANPMLTGSHHMLRRSYSFDNGPGDSGLLFACYQRDLRTFVVTQQQLDQSDDLMQYATPTAGGTFLVVPGFSTARPLGASLTAAR